MPTDSKTLDELCINTIRILAADAVQNANSGHPGMPMGAAAMAYTLWSRYLKFNPKNPAWFDRDRFVLSAGHGSMLLYGLLHLTGYDLPLEEIKRFRQLVSKTPGHPERGLTPGVEVSTGPLGQGFGNGVGMGIAETFLAARFNKPGHNIIDHYIYAICGDGDLMEGITQEAASLAGHLKLGKLVYLYDNNHISLAGQTSLTFTENTQERFDAYQWHTRQVADGNDTAEVAAAIEEARKDPRPSLILVRTHIGYGSPNKHDNFAAHGSPLGEEELAATKKALGWSTMDKFYIPDEALAHFREAIPKGAAAEAEWTGRLNAYRAAYPAECAELEGMMAGRLPAGWDADLPKWKLTDKAIATRVAGGQALNAIAKRMPNVIGGSADLNPSTETALKGLGDFQPPDTDGKNVQGEVGGVWSYAGQNVAFGVREHAMGAAVNGMAAHGGVHPFSATFLVFSDYMKPAIRLGALSDLKSLYIFTHDSIGVGEDGPTHEPVEQIAGLRAIPGLVVIRPADPNETSEAYRFAIPHDGPVLIALTRQNVPHISQNPPVAKGAYVLADCEGTSDVILVGTGSEVALCVKAQEKLKGYGVKARVVSMPSWELFAAQDAAYREQVLPKAVRKRVCVEAESPFGWERWAGDEGAIIGMNRYGLSAPGAEVMKYFGFTVEHVTSTALRLLGKFREAEEVEPGKGGETAVKPTGPQEGHS
jgi:transketolase